MLDDPFYETLHSVTQKQYSDKLKGVTYSERLQCKYQYKFDINMGILQTFSDLIL